MEQSTARKLQQVGKAFKLEGPFYSYEEISQGNVNRTYKVNYILDDGTGMAVIKSYLVQRVNTYAFRDPIALMDNVEQVTEHIRKKNPDKVNLHYHHTDRTGEHLSYLWEGNEFWRVCNYVPSVTFDATDDLGVIHSTGEAFGEFQTALSDFDANKLHYTIPDFHDTRKRYEAFQAAVEQDSQNRAAVAKDDIAWLLAARDQACCLTDLYNKGDLPQRVTHNDTKINNVLFDEATHKALVVVDLDTVMPGLVGHDFGDAVRFAANFVEEDSNQFGKAGVNLNVFWAIADGFLSKVAPVLTATERDTLALSCFSLSCELATRFLADYLNGDKYFRIAYPDHNLTRARCQIALAKDMLVKMDAMDAIVQRCCEKYGR